MSSGPRPALSLPPPPVLPKGYLLRARRFALCVGAGVVLGAPSGWIYYHVQLPSRLTQAELRMQAIAERRAEWVTTWRAERLADIRALIGISASYPQGVSLSDSQKLTALVSLLGKDSTSFRGIRPLILAADLRPLPGQADMEDANHLADGEGRAAVQRLLAGQEIVEIPSMLTPAGEWQKFWLAPIKSSVGAHLAGVALLRLRTSDLAEIARQNDNAPTNLHFSIWRANRAGWQMLFAGPKGPGMALNARQAEALLPPALRGGHPSIRYNAPEMMLASAHQVPDSQWVVVAREPASRVTEPLKREAGLLAAGVTGSVFFATVAGSAFLGRRREQREREHIRTFAALAERNLAIMNTASDGIHVLDSQGRFIEVNAAFCQMLGYSREEMLQMSILDVDLDLTAEEFRSKFETLPSGGSLITRRHRRRDGECIEVEVGANRVLYEGNVFVYGASRNITARRQAEARIRRLSQVVEQARVSILITDPKGAIIYANPYCLSLTGYTMDEVEGKNPRLFSSGDTPRGTYEELWRTLRAGQTWSGEFRNRHRNGTIIIERAVITPVHDEHGEIIAMAAIKEDITALREQERQFYRLHRLHMILGRTSDLLARARSADTMLQGVCDLLVEGGFTFAWVAWHAPEAQALAPRAKSGTAVCPPGTTHLADAGPVVEAFATGRQVVRQHFECGGAVNGGPVAAISLVAIPIDVQGTIEGVLVVHAEAGLEMQRDEIDLLTRIGGNLSFSLDALELDARRLLTESRLRDSEQRFRDIFDLVSDAILVVDCRSLRIVMANRAAALIYRLPQEELADSMVDRLTVEQHPNLLQLAEELPLDESLRIPKRWQRRADGEVFPAEIGMRPFRRAGRLLVIAVVRDITEQEKAREALESFARKLEAKVADRTREIAERNRELQALFQAVPDMVLRLNAAGDVLFFQQAKVGERLMALCALGMEKCMATPRLRPALMDIAQRARQSGVLEMGEVEAPFMESQVPLELRAAPTGSDEVVVFIRDVTERHRMEEVMTEALRAEREASAMKSRFISVTSHEFRTPMSAALAASDVLKSHSDQISPAQREALIWRIDSSMRRMSNMLDDLLTLNRVSSGSMTPFIVEVDLLGLVEEIVEEARLSDADGHRFSLRTHGDCSSVRSDGEMLRHVLTSLVNNALRYSLRGSLVSIRLRAESGGFAVSVADTGIGIPLADQNRIFAPFERGSNTVGISGSGLGLSIAREIAQRLHGRITFTSIEGQGSVFTFAFGEVDSAEPPAPPSG